MISLSTKVYVEHVTELIAEIDELRQMLQLYKQSKKDLERSVLDYEAVLKATTASLTQPETLVFYRMSTKFSGNPFEYCSKGIVLKTLPGKQSRYACALSCCVASWYKIVYQQSYLKVALVRNF